MNALLRIWAVLLKELRQLVRDRVTFGMIVGIPLMQMLLFGYAINQDVRDLTGAYVDLADTGASRQLIAELGAAQIARFPYRSDSVAELERLLDAGDIHVGLYIPPDFERRLHDPARPLAQLLVSGADVLIVRTALQARALPFDARGGSRVSLRPPHIDTRVYYNTEGRSAVFIIPGLIGVILTMTMTLFTSVAIVRERERGNLELLITTPVREIELMVGKILPYIAIGLVQVTLVLIVGVWWFQVPFRGTLPDLYLGSLAFIMATLTLGLLISTIARSQFQAMQVTMFVFLPSILLSGFMFPFEGMPRLFQYLAQVLPLTHYVRIIRGVVLRGADLSQLVTELAALGVFFVVALALAVARFRKRLD
ncbi:MAG TPA: ABC transporter permease [Xanthomonadaceae bacterium]|nr:ABC transporter permease [Xanthomonadaceae bacterium]